MISPLWQDYKSGDIQIWTVGEFKVDFFILCLVTKDFVFLRNMNRAVPENIFLIF